MKNITKLKVCMVFLILTLSLIIATTNAEAITEAHGVALTDGTNNLGWANMRGMKFDINQTICVYNMTKHSSTTANQCVLGNYTGAGTQTTLGTGTFTGDFCELTTPIEISFIANYTALPNGTSGNIDVSYSIDGGGAHAVDTGFIYWRAGFRMGLSDDGRFYGIESIGFTEGTCPPPTGTYSSSANATSPLEQQPVNYALNITYDNTSYTLVNLTFNFNGTNYTTTWTDNGTLIRSNNTITTPIIGGNSSLLSYTWYAEWNSTNATETGSITAYKVLLDDCTTHSTISLNITIRNESDNALTHGDLDLLTEYESIYGVEYNFSTNKTGITYQQLCIAPSTATIYSDFWFDYESSYFPKHTYHTFNTNLNSTLQTINLLFVDGTTNVTFYVKDTNDNELRNVLISVLKYDVSTNSYTTTEILETDDDGKAIGRIILNDVFYKFILSRNGTQLLETNPVIIDSTSKEFRVNLDQDYFDRYTYVRDIAHTLTFNNATNNFRFTWNDPAGIVHYACLRVMQRDIYSDTEINDTCTLSTSGTILVNIAAENYTYVATSYLRFDEEFILDIISAEFGSRWGFYGVVGVLISFLIIGTMALVSWWSMPAAVVLICVGFVFTNILQFFHLDWEYLITLIVMGGILLYKVSKE